jgi:hypothetical protein
MSTSGNQAALDPSLPSPPGMAPTVARMEFMAANPPFRQGQPPTPPPPPSAPGKAPSIAATEHYERNRPFA